MVKLIMGIRHYVLNHSHTLLFTKYWRELDNTSVLRADPFAYLLVVYKDYKDEDDGRYDR